MSDTNVPTPEPTPAYQPAYQPAPEPKKRPLPAGWIIAGVLLLAVVAISANASGDHEPAGSTGTSSVTSVEDDEQALAESAWVSIGAESRESICVIYRIDPDTSEAMMRNADGFQVNEIDNLMTILARDC